MGSNASRLDDQIVRQLCRQMQDITQVCEGMALKLLDLEGRLEQLDSSVQGVTGAMETDGLNELLDTVGGRLGDLKGLLGVDIEATHAVDPVCEDALNDAPLEDVPIQEEEPAQKQDEVQIPEAEAGGFDESTEEHEDAGLDTVYVDDPQMDLMSA